MLTKIRFLLKKPLQVKKTSKTLPDDAYNVLEMSIVTVGC